MHDELLNYQVASDVNIDKTCKLLVPANITVSPKLGLVPVVHHP
jgi:hypothetical protein